jgi:alpha-beta hydrolase superfamily lysophospholipase
MRKLRRLAVWVGGALALVVLAIVVVRAIEAQRGPGLSLWHKVVPPELSIAELDHADWAGWMAAENRAFAVVQREVTAALPPEDQAPVNRFFAASPMHTPRLATDWNRSFVLQPDGTPLGVAVLLHGLTDAPFSMRHLAQQYREAGFLAIGLRVPGHGTVPAGLTDVTWEQWMAAVRLAVREARVRVPAGRPLHLVGYSNGGALALKYALDSVADQRLARPDQVVLLSPMIGVTAFARFAGLAGLPAFLPAFAAAAWLDILPEFNPFKYNSFPVNAARQSHRLPTAVQAQIDALTANGQIARLPPVLTFQSVVDATVSTRAVLTGLYARLPANGSELVLFDVNRNAKAGPLLTPAAAAAITGLQPVGAQRFRLTLITNASADSPEAVERSTAAGSTAMTETPLGLSWPREVFSLSHIALPFPPQDGLYGNMPDPTDDFGLQLGAVALRGERGVLVTSLDSLIRVSSNPFFAYVSARLGAVIRPAQ